MKRADPESSHKAGVRRSIPDEREILQSSSLRIATGWWVRTFAVITTAANEMISEIHGRIPVIVVPIDDDRWLAPEPDLFDLIRADPPPN